MISRVLHRNLGHDYPIAVDADRIHVIDQHGNRYLDGSCGAAITAFGAKNRHIIAAAREQLETLPFAYTTGFTNEPLEELARFVVENAPEGIDYAYFVGSGSEAVEAAIMLARQYALETGQTQRSRVIARTNSYHGSTLGTLAVGHNARGSNYAPLRFDVHHIATCYPYRQRGAVESVEDYSERAANELQKAIEQLGPDTVLAFVAETVIGGNAGAVDPSAGYFERIRAICDEHGVLLVLDEVMCGLGRTGSYFAFEQEAIRPDIVAIAKSLAGGCLPIGGVLMGAHVYNAIRDGSGTFQHGHSFLGHAACCAAALAAQRLLLHDGVLDNIRIMSDVLDLELRDRFQDHPAIGEIRGRGLFRGLEIVADRASKKPFDPQDRIADRIRAAAMDFGLFVYTGSGCIDGTNGDFVLIAPPYVSSRQEIRSISELLDQAIEAAI